MIFVSAIFARATLTAKMALTAKMRGLHLLPKCVDYTYCQNGGQPKMAANQKWRTQFWLSDPSGIIYHLWFSVDQLLILHVK